jgi:type IV fimbrial biogenesis protein FimT
MQPATLRTRGFTLIELLMCIAILAVLLAIAAPSYATLIGRTHGQTARGELDTALNLARMSAVTRGVHVVACPSDDGNQCSRTTQWHHGWVVFADPDHDGTRAAEEPVLATAQAQPAGVAILSTVGRLRVDYRPDGSAAGTNLTLTVCDRGAGAADATTLTVNQAGRVRRGTATQAAAAACIHAAG